jgi:dethiobiotin synthetase
MAGLFVTGTDTGVGKTLVAAGLLAAYARQGLRVIGMKPVAAGMERRGEEWVNEDVVWLSQAASLEAPLDWINPYRFVEAVAPHLAAREAGVALDIKHIAACFAQLAARADVVVVEGAGGFLVPLDARATFADLAKRLDLPVVLVVGMRLGCLNHALLTAEAVERRGLTLAGWVANRIDPHMARFEENLAALKERLPGRLLGVLPHFSAVPQAAGLASFLAPPRLDGM